MACACSIPPAFDPTSPTQATGSSQHTRTISTTDTDFGVAAAARCFRQQSSSSSMLQPPVLSLRGQAHGEMVTPFWNVFDRIIGNAYCHETNPEGICNLAISNNYLMESELLAFFRSNLRMVPTDLTYGTSLFGSHRLFAALCKLFNSPVFAARRLVEPQHLITGPGCGPLLDQIFEHLCDPGDAVLIAAPYYNGYDADLACRGHVQCVPVHSETDEGCGPHNFEGRTALRGFEKAKLDWEAANVGMVRAIIVCNPHNPVGRCYDRDALLEYGRFAQEQNLHLVFDEIFAMSTFDPRCKDLESIEHVEPFRSAHSIDWAVEAQCHPARVHLVWSASKDLCCNGLRVAGLVSQANPDLLRAMKATAKLYMVSSAADALLCALMEDEVVCKDFVETNQARMAQAYETVVRWCHHHKITYLPSRAGHFVMIDLERFLPSSLGEHALQGMSKEAALWAKLLDHAVCLTPGSNYHHNHLGTFRLTFTLRRPALLEGLARIERALQLQPWSLDSLPACCTAPEPAMTSGFPKALTEATKDAETADSQDFSLAHRTADTPSAEEAQTERRRYIDAFEEILVDGADGSALKMCGMGLPRAC